MRNESVCFSRRNCVNVRCEVIITSNGHLFPEVIERLNVLETVVDAERRVTSKPNSIQQPVTLYISGTPQFPLERVAGTAAKNAQHTSRYGTRCNCRKKVEHQRFFLSCVDAGGSYQPGDF